MPAAILLGVLALAGCSQPVGSVSGKVTYEGKQLKGGSVSFVSSDGGQSFASGIAEDGTYKVPNIKGGTYKVCVETESLKPTGGAMPGGPKGMGGGGSVPKMKSGPPPGAPVPEGYSPSDPAAAATANSAKKYVKIPEKYGAAGTTDLTYTFKGGDDTFNIDLK